MGNDLPEDVIYQARLIVARAKFWTSEIEKLLRKWRKQIRQRYLGHKKKEGQYWYWLYGTAIFVILLGTINAVISFGSSDPCEEATSIALNINGTEFTAFLKNPSNGSSSIRFIVGTLSAIAAGVTAISALFDFGGIRKANRDAASDCDALAREIDDLLTQQIPQRGDPIAELQKIRNKFDIVVQNSPSVSEKFRTSLEYASFEKKNHHYNHHRVVKPPSSDVDLAGIRKRKKNVDVGVLADILVQDMQNAEDEKESIKKANDYDTDDEDNEDRKVMLPFDPDDFRPGDILEDDRTKIVRESLQRAMEFELSRLEDSDPNTMSNTMSNNIDHTIDPCHVDVEKVIDSPLSEDIAMEEIVVDTIENGEVYSEKISFE